MFFRYTFSKSFFFPIIVVGFLFLVLSTAYAVSIFDITYPIPELGNCADQQACKAYCDDLANKDACTTFAEARGFISKEEGEQIKNIPTSGPGGCDSQTECKNYCNDESHNDECLAFAEQHGIGGEVRGRAKLIREEGGPGNCQSEGECRAYCNNPSNQKECLAFAEDHGFIDKKESQRIRTILDEGGPGECKSEAECRIFCENQDHFDECVKFAEENDLISKDEANQIKRLPPVGPGGCKGEACRTYCEDETHQAECLKFAEDNGLMSKEELERARKFAGKPGPGGCRGEACRTYCADPTHGEECLRFAEENGFLPKEEIERAKKFMKIANEGGPGGCRGEACRTYCETSDHEDECFEFAKKNSLISPEELERAEKGRGLSKKVKESGGPGGCTSDEECRAYCAGSDHLEECAAFAVAHGGLSKDEAEKMLNEFIQNDPRARFRPQEDIERFKEAQFRRFEEFEGLEGKFRGAPMIPPQGGIMQMNFQGPGGCDSPDSCITYCSDSAHRDECARFNPGQQNAPPPGELFRQTKPGYESIERTACDDRVAPACPSPKIVECHNGQWTCIGPAEGVGGARFIGPGGCTTAEECTKYCSDSAHFEACKGVSAPASGGSIVPIPSQQYPYPNTNIMPYPSYPSGDQNYPYPGMMPPSEPLPSGEPTGGNGITRFLSNIGEGLLNFFR